MIFKSLSIASELISLISAYLLSICQLSTKTSKGLFLYLFFSDDKFFSIASLQSALQMHKKFRLDTLNVFWKENSGAENFFHKSEEDSVNICIAD